MPPTIKRALPLLALPLLALPLLAFGALALHAHHRLQTLETLGAKIDRAVEATRVPASEAIWAARALPNAPPFAGRLGKHTGAHHLHRNLLSPPRWERDLSLEQMTPQDPDGWSLAPFARVQILCTSEGLFAPFTVRLHPGGATHDDLYLQHLVPALTDEGLTPQVLPHP